MSIVTGSEIVSGVGDAPRRPGLLARVQRVLGEQLRVGASPRRLALSLALGGLIGIMPLLWGASLICLGLSRLFRLNLVALQLANCLVYPLYLACFIPFLRLGKTLAASLGFSPDHPSLPPAGWLQSLVAGNALGLLAWLLLSLVAFYPLFLVLHIGVLQAKKSFLTKN